MGRIHRTEAMSPAHTKERKAHLEALLVIFKRDLTDLTEQGKDNLINLLILERGKHL